jgi:uncharacterized membrane protein YjfL (UPF0719 family)
MMYLTIPVIVLAAVVFVFVADWMMSKWYSDKTIRDDGNLAVALQRGGLNIGLAIGLVSALIGPSKSLMRDLQSFLIDGVITFGLLVLVRLLNEFVLYPKIKNATAIRNGNVAVGTIEASSYIATGCIIAGAMFGEGGSVFTGIAFVIAGQLVLYVLFALAQACTRIDEQEAIRSGNPACGLLIGSKLVALGLILASSVAGPFVSWGQDLVSFGLSAVIGAVVLLLIHRFLVPAILTKADLNQAVASNNMAVVAVMASLDFVAALLIAAVIL